MKKTYCIICGEEKNGLAVENDFVIDVIRWVKANVTKNEQGNRLVVCRECYPKYASLRKKSVSRTYMYLFLGILLAIMIVLAQPGVLSFFIALAAVVALYLFSFLSYIPRLALGENTKS